MSTSPSQIAVQAAGRAHNGNLQAKVKGYCTMCGYAHAEGDPVTPFEPKDSFTDYAALRHRASQFLCGWCAATLNGDFTQKALKSVMCDEGVFPAASNPNIAYWIFNPPKGKWIWVMGDQKQQHIVWRATVNTSQDVFQVMLGENNMTVRRPKALQAFDAAKRLASAASIGRKGAILKSPFVSLSRDLNQPGHGAIRPDLYKLAETNESVRSDIAILRSCTPGEFWALTALLYAMPSEERPLPYFSAHT